MDEIWIHYFTPETKEQSKWTSLDEPAPKKAKTVKSAGKVMATVFWNARGIIHIDYLPSKQTRLLYSLLDRFNNILKKKRPYLVKKKVLFHQDNAVHTCPVPMAKFNEFRYELFPHLAYSPDLVPCDYFLFSNLKKWFEGKRFTIRERSSPKQRIILKGWNHIIRTVWKSWRIVRSNISSWKETMLRNKNESIKKNVFF